ncbi:molybdenum ABC transporter ATP-binding protein ModC [Amphritea sp. HPY]|uniref:molybdenum ABC transporter ATP-binding protein ModC n=1 Tax=Amphritea sp. HPY TaxID=3421652 RepID=UPI003D7E5E94
MLRIQIKKQLGELTLDTDLELPMHGISALFGRSGAGKTSLVNLIGGLQQPDQGRIAVGERVLFDSKQGLNLAPEKRKVGYVFQDARLFPHYRVRGNLNYGNRNKNTQQFDAIIELLGIEHLLERFPSALSGGEKQRVAIGRALLSNPALLLMDEPLASLDGPRKSELLPYLERLSNEVQLPILYVSHNLDEILRLADQLILLDKGKVVENGPLAEVWSSSAMIPWLPEQDSSVVLEASLAEQHPDYEMSRIALCQQTGQSQDPLSSQHASLWTSRIDAPIGCKIRIRIHARDVSLVREMPKQSSIRNILPVTIREITSKTNADNCLITLQAGSAMVRSNITRWAAEDLNLQIGDSLFAQIKGMSVSREDLASAMPRTQMPQV